MLPKQPNSQLFKAPEGYFEGLPEQILQRHQQRGKKVRQLWLAASLSAAVLLMGLFFWNQPEMPTDSLNANLSAEINFYINAGYWEAEDILNLSDNPNQLLDDLIASEWNFVEEDLDYEFEENWYY
ncbi:hypothetical protein [Mongoliitalea daihaiensis]|uniref:hypothetical protein n=1 Tax=Mongoliitalea daihaiensis TaxID=2782006 RepID=UPI001F18999B|nr:hypothetical protein [Mongoliitalea daihaiensis]UJP64420.1 hypothetical protein IPZ59_16665 [Mongoliitalea daihaiensis]